MSYMPLHRHIPPGAAAAVEVLGPEALEEGGRFAGTWSVAFQGGTFERLQQRCSDQVYRYTPRVARKGRPHAHAFDHMVYPHSFARLLIR